MGAKQLGILLELREQQRKMELILKQKLRELWLKDSNKNFKFFVDSTLVRRRQNMIFTIKDQNG